MSPAIGSTPRPDGFRMPDELEVHTMPMPAIMVITEDEAWGVDSAEGSIPRVPGDKTAASYLNFLIVNDGVIMPVFDDPNDTVALDTLRRLFPDRKVLTVPGREIVLGGGNVHCVTRQQPRRGDALSRAPHGGAGAHHL